MAKTVNQQRMIANEAVFREHNEQVQQQLDELKAIAAEDNQLDMVPDHDMPLYFVCECADENCKQRVSLTPSEYNDIHTNRKRFVVVPGHESALVERIISEPDGYTIVEKHETPPESPPGLQLTSVNNV